MPQCESYRDRNIPENQHRTMYKKVKKKKRFQQGI